MGVVVAFVSQKGGVGKSTLARALARESAAGGLKVKVADLDIQQGTLVNWQRRRLAAGREPTVSVESFRNASSALSEWHSYDLLVLDGPARANSATLDIAKFAHLVIQPTGASLDDLEPAVLTFHELVKEGITGKARLYALSCANRGRGTGLPALPNRGRIRDFGRLSSGAPGLPGSAERRVCRH
jgi:chromosome partitioning protein